MKLVTFNIVMNDGNLEQRRGYRRKINGEDFFFENECYGYVFHHAKTGCFVHSGYSFKKTVAEIKVKMEANPNAFNLAKDLIIKNRHKYPVN